MTVSLEMIVIVVLFLTALGLAFYAYGTIKKVKESNRIIRNQAGQISRKNQQLAKKNEELIQLNAEKNHLIGIVSHDLKSPLNRVFALTNLIKMDSDTPLSDSQKEYLERILKVVSEGLTLIRNLLDIRAIEDAGIEIRLEPLDIKSAINQQVGNFISIAEKKDIRMVLNSDISDPEMVGDRQYIDRIAENFLSNAVKYTRVGGKIEVILEERGEYIRFSVKDEGPGISERDQPRLWQKFQVLESQPTGGENSTGLGLSIVRALVETMGGTVGFTTEKGKGSVFWADLPTKPGKQDLQSSKK